LKKVKDSVHRAISPSRKEPESKDSGFSLSRYGQMYLSAFNSNGKRNRQSNTNLDDLTDDEEEKEENYDGTRPSTSVSKRSRSSSVKEKTQNLRQNRQRKSYDETKEESDSDTDFIPRI